jgi:hypothetical protein
MQALAWLALAGAWTVGAAAMAAPAPEPLFKRDVRVVIDISAPVNTFTPDQALGAALDGLEKDEVEPALTPFNVSKMRSSGLKRITYRTRPELGIEAWHWTEEGTWSDPAHAQGYWTGSDNPSPDPTLTWGYSLPRRGDTIDNANNVGYSRLDDGDPLSFWKSNPYLDRRYTGLPQSRPQWMVFSFVKATRIDAARILWGAPFARHFLVQYWEGDEAYWEGKEVATGPGGWKTFPHGDVTIAGDPDERVIRLSDAPISAHFVRIMMTESSETAPAGSTDIRDRLGYAVREVSLGVERPDGGLDDAMRHGKSKVDQTLVQVSSTDPWHRAVDRDLGTEQPGLGFVFKSGLTGGMPMMVPVGVFYDTPDNAAAEVRYITRRGWPVTEVELGEEPDGQFIRPEDYADLYLQTARAVRGVDPSLRLGGPSMQSALTGVWPDPEEGASWTGRFVAELKARGGLDQLQFFSFEHYVFDAACRPPGEMLRDETDIMDRIIRQTTAAGVSRQIPWVISEYGFSPFAGRAMSEMPSALLAADIVGHFLSAGGSAAYMFGLTPDTPENQNFPCAGYGNMMLFEVDDDGASKWPMPVYYAERMMMLDWGAPADQPHRLYGAAADLRDAKGRPVVVTYPLRGPDGRWRVMLINRDSKSGHSVRIAMNVGGSLRGPLSIVQYSPEEYAWLERGEDSHPIRDLPPRRFTLAGGPIKVPAFSLTVVTEALR